MVNPILTPPQLQPVASLGNTYYTPAPKPQDFNVADLAGLSVALQANQLAYKEASEADASTDEFLASLSVPAGQGIPSDPKTTKQAKQFRDTVPAFANPYNVSVGVTEAAARDLVTKFEAELGRSMQERMRVVDAQGNLVEPPSFDQVFQETFSSFAQAPVLASGNKIGRRAAAQLLQQVKGLHELAYAKARGEALDEHHTSLVINELAMDTVDPKTGAVLQEGRFQRLINVVRWGDPVAEEKMYASITQEITDRIYNRGLDPANVLHKAVGAFLKKERAISAADASAAIDILENIKVGNQTLGTDARFADLLSSFRVDLTEQEYKETEWENQKAEAREREATRLMSDKFVPQLAAASSPGQLRNVYDAMRAYAQGLDAPNQDAALLQADRLYLQAQESPANDSQPLIDRIRNATVVGDLTSARSLLESAPPSALRMETRVALDKEIDAELSGQGVSAVGSDISRMRTNLLPRIAVMTEGYQAQAVAEMERLTNESLRQAQTAFLNLPEQERTGAAFKALATPLLAETQKQVEQTFSDLNTQRIAALKELEGLARAGSPDFREKFESGAWQLFPDDATKLRQLYASVQSDVAFLEGNHAFHNLKEQIRARLGQDRMEEAQAVLQGADDKALKFLDEARRSGTLNQDSFSSFVRTQLGPEIDKQTREGGASPSTAVDVAQEGAIREGAGLDKAAKDFQVLRAQAELAQGLGAAIHAKDIPGAVKVVEGLATKAGLSGVPIGILDGLKEFYSDKDDDWFNVFPEFTSEKMHEVIHRELASMKVPAEQMGQATVNAHTGFYLPASAVLSGKFTITSQRVGGESRATRLNPFRAPSRNKTTIPAMDVDISTATLPQASVAYFKTQEELEAFRSSPQWLPLLQRIGVPQDEFSQDAFVTAQALMIEAIQYDG